MPYTVWKNGKQIGATQFELSPGGRKRVGMFHPNEYGLTVLPGITAMFPALLEFGEMCRRNGVDVEFDSPEKRAAGHELFAETPEGRAVIEAAQNIGELELRDSRGETLVWDSLAISDVGMFADLAISCGENPETRTSESTGPAYMISATLAPRLRVPLDPSPVARADARVC
jgi:hypothetical protein